MKKVNIYLIFSLIISTFLLNSCNNNSSTVTYPYVGNWTWNSNFAGDPRYGATCFTINTDTVKYQYDNKVFVFGGENINNLYNDIWEFDIMTGISKLDTVKQDSIPSRRICAVSFSIGGAGYIGTGLDEQGNYLNDFWKFDTKTFKWTRMANFPGVGRFQAVAFSINGKGYVGTGVDIVGSTHSDFYQFDPTAGPKGTWTQIPNLAVIKEQASVFVINKIAYLVGGINNQQKLEDFWKFDPSSPDQTKWWTKLRSIGNFSNESYDDDYTSIPRYAASTFVINSKGYLACGTSYQGAYRPEVWEYNPTNDQWYQKTSFEGTLRINAIGFSLNNRGFIALGTNGSILSDIFEFQPGATQDPNDNGQH